MENFSNTAQMGGSVHMGSTLKTLSSKSPAIVYHKGCLDGFGGAYVFYLKYGLTVEYFQGVYQEFDITPLFGREVYFVDFSVSADDIAILLSKGCKITVLDHHRTAIEALSGIQHPNFINKCDMQRSGCILAWQHCFPGKSIPGVFLHIEDRDLWKFSIEGTREVTSALYSLRMNFQTWSEEAFQISKLKEIGVHLLRQQENSIRSILAASTRSIRIHGIDTTLVNCPHMFTSELSNLILEEDKEILYIVTYYDTRSSRKFSLRSRGDFDVSKIAQEFGGGGHPAAAGFSVSREHPLARI